MADLALPEEREEIEEMAAGWRILRKIPAARCARRFSTSGAGRRP